MWKDAVLVTLSCVLAIQMGLIEAIGKVLHYEFKILSCPKCLTFWFSLAVHLLHRAPVLESVTVSFLSSYAALWLCLLYDALAILYNYAYEKLSPQEDAPEAESSSDEVSGLQ